MTIKELTIFSTNPEKQGAFYREVLGLDVITVSARHVSVQVGTSFLHFKKGDKKYIYHYCFLIPKNKIIEAANWLSHRLDPIQEEDGKMIHRSENWDAEQIYFFDADGNVAEFIMHNELDNASKKAFNENQILSVCEIGMAVTDLAQIDEVMKRELGLTLWDGNLSRFAVFGDANGRFISVNNLVKKTWYPTDLPIEKSPYEAIIGVGSDSFRVNFQAEQFTATKA